MLRMELTSRVLLADARLSGDDTNTQNWAVYCDDYETVYGRKPVGDRKHYLEVDNSLREKWYEWVGRQ